MAALHGYSSTSAQEFRRDPTLLLGDVTRLSFEYGVAKPELKGSDLAWWIETMKQQDMLQGSLDLNKLVLP
jgi:hypothetical protein